MNTAIQRIAKITRDLLEYDPSLIILGRTNAKIEDFKKPIITIDANGIIIPLGKSERYDGEAEQMYYSNLIQTPLTISFFGENNAYQRATEFSLKIRSQLSMDLQNKHKLSIFDVGNLSDITELTGEQYYNRIDINLNVYHDETISIETLRIDEAQFKFTTQ